MSVPSISVIVPAFNEGLELAPLLDELARTLAELCARYRLELVLIDDGSDDETPAVLAAFAQAHPQLARLVTHPVNRGLTAALTTGVAAAHGEIVVMLDADLSYEPAIVERLVEALVERDADAVLASPYMRGGRAANVPLDRLVASRGANLLLGACIGFRLHTLTGMVRAYRTTALRETLRGPVRGEFNAGLAAAFIRDGRRIVEIPAALVWRPARALGAPRLTRAKLWFRAKQVLVTLGVLWQAGAARALGPSVYGGTFGPVNRPR